VQHPKGEVMTSTSHEPPTSRKKHPVSAALHTLEKNVQPLVTFWTKFNNDWCAGSFGHPFSKKPIFACFHHNTTKKCDMKELYYCTEQASTFFGVRLASLPFFGMSLEYFGGFGALFGTSCSLRSDNGILSGLQGRALL
jgi:hypothetical protein